MKFKNGISPVVAIALLLVVSVVAVVSLQTWFDTYSSGIYGNVEIQSQSSTESVSIETVVGDQLYVKGDNITVKQVLIDGVECDISVNISGVENISLSECLNSATSKTPEVTIVTDSKVISKKIYLPEINPINSGSQVGSISPIYTDTFISVWNTSISSEIIPYFGSTKTCSESNQISLPLIETGTYNFVIDWGDGSNDTITSYNQPEVTHTYSSEGTYTLKITGIIKGFQFAGGGDRNKLIEIKAWGPLNLGNDGLYFAFCENFDFTGTDDLNLEGTTNLMGIFVGAIIFDGDIGDWNVSNVINMFAMFNGATNFNQDLSNWDVSSVNDMSVMFSIAENFNQDISNWNVSSVTNMSYMFSEATKFNSDIEGWEVGNVIDMEGMFSGDENFNQDISSWNVSSVTNMFAMFNGAHNFNQDISSWNVSSVTNMNSMFYIASSYNKSLNSWDVSQVTDMGEMFASAYVFNGNISSWNVSQVTNMSFMFSYGFDFNSDISNWNVSQVTNMSGIFNRAINFNQDLSNWDVDQVNSCLYFNSTATSWESSNQIDFAGQGSSCTP